MKRKISMILVLVLVIGTLLPSMAFADPYKKLNMEQYELKSFHSRIFNDLPWGLFKRGGNLPPGLAKKTELPHGLSKVFQADNFELYVNKMIIKYDRDETEIEKIIDDIKALLDEDPIVEEDIEELLEKLEEMYLWYQFLDNVDLIIDRCGDLDTSLVNDIEDLMDDSANKDEIEDLIEELQELCDEYENYEETMKEYKDLVVDIKLIIEDEDTGDSFMDTFELWNDLVDPDYAELLEAIGVLEALLDYLDDMFTIEEGIAVLGEYKDDMEEIIEDDEFTTGAGFGLYFPSVETTFDGYIADIEEIVALTNPELFGIILMISDVEEFLATYEEMRYITEDEYDDYVIMRGKVLDISGNPNNLKEIKILIAELDGEIINVGYFTKTQYNDFVEKYDELKTIYSSF